MPPPANGSRLERALRAANQTHQLRIGPGALAETLDAFHGEFGHVAPAAIVADPNSFAVAGRAVLEQFRAAGHPLVEPLILSDPDLYAEWRFIERVEASLRTHDAIPVAIGSGTINDLVKLASHHLNRPYVCVGTAASMDGYTAFAASITKYGAKQTFDCPAPRVVVADMDVICAAPPEMTAAGYADLLAKLPAGADWIIADALSEQPIDPTSWDLVQGPLRESLAAPHGIPTGDVASVGPLMEGLLMSGFAIQSLGNSRPAAGAEHQFSHLWDMQHHTHNGAAPSHGFKVGVASVAVARFYDVLLERPLHELDVESAVAAWPGADELRSIIDRTYDEPEIRAFARSESTGKQITRDALRKQLNHVRAIWPELANRIRTQLPPARDLATMLLAAGAPTEPEQIGISRDRLRRSFVQALYLRRRVGVLDLAARANVLGDCLDDLFAAG